MNRIPIEFELDELAAAAIEWTSALAHGPSPANSRACVQSFFTECSRRGEVMWPRNPVLPRCRGRPRFAMI